MVQRDPKVPGERANRISYFTVLLQAFRSIIRSIFNYIVSLIDSFFYFFSKQHLNHLAIEISGWLMPSFVPDDSLFENESDFGDFFGEHRGGEKFLGKYTEADLTRIISNSSLGKKLNDLVDDWYIEFDLRDCFSHYAYLRSASLPDKEQFYGFIIANAGQFIPDRTDTVGSKFIRTHLAADVNFLNIKWFSLQNPKAQFRRERPRLPGQRYPGTGLGRAALEIVLGLARHSSRDGIINNPEHFHNAYMYENFLFLDPTAEGWFEALKEGLAESIEKHGLALVSWAIYLGFVTDGGQKVTWGLREQVLPVSSRMRRYFASRNYRKEVAAARKAAGPFEVDWNAAENSAMAAVIAFSDEELTFKHNCQ